MIKNFKEIVSFLKDKGFIFSGSEIYGGLSNSWDYGPLGALLKDNIKNLWKKQFIYTKDNVHFLDSSIFMNKKVWEASGHLSEFDDPVIECLNNNKRYRADKLIEENTDLKPSTLNLFEMTKIIKEKVFLPEFGKNTKWDEVKKFKLMFEFNDSKINDKDKIYLRPETAQGAYINFKNILNTYNFNLPFGIAQIGKSFRNEVTPGNFIFRTREFEQMELQFFVEKKDEEKYFDLFKKEIEFFLKRVNISKDNLKLINVDKEELAHYSKKTIDFEFNYSFGWGELLGLSNRGDFDIKNHIKHSKQNLHYIDSNEKNQKIIPSVIESSFGVERLFLAIISNNLKKVDDRDILTLPFDLAPYKLAVAPLTNKLNDQAYKIFIELLNENIGPIIFSKNSSIGKRYRKLDQIGIPFIVTYDFDSINDEMVTIRHRDSMKQSRVKISEIRKYILKNAK